MLFMIGLSQMSRDEKIALLSTVNCLTTLNLMKQDARRRVKKGSNAVLSGASRVAGLFSYRAARGIRSFGSAFDWNPDVLQATFRQEAGRLSRLSPQELTSEMKRFLIRIGDGKDSTSDVADAIVRRAARSLRIDPAKYPDTTALESRVFEAFIQELMEVVEREISAPSRKEALADIIREEIGKLSEANKQAMGKAMGLDEISASSVVTFLKSTSGVAIAQIIVGSLGFGSYRFLTTMIKSLSLLFGTTFAFPVYLWATSTLAFLLSTPFLLLASAAVGGALWRKTYTAVDDQIAKVLVAVGRSKQKALIDRVIHAS